MRVESDKQGVKPSNIKEMSDSPAERKLLDEFSSLLDQIARKTKTVEQNLPEMHKQTAPTSRRDQPELKTKAHTEHNKEASSQEKHSQPMDEGVKTEQKDEPYTKEQQTDTDSEQRLEGGETEESQVTADDSADEETVSSESQQAVDLDSQSSDTELSAEELSQLSSEHVATKAHNVNDPSKAAPEQSGEGQKHNAVTKNVDQQLVASEAQPSETTESAAEKSKVTQSTQQHSAQMSALLKEMLARVEQPVQQPAQFSSIQQIVQKVLAQMRGEALSSGSAAISAANNATHAQSALSGLQQLTGDMHQQLHGEKSQKSKEAQKPMASADAARTLKRVQEVLEEAAKSRDGKQISLRLDPPSLGKVNVDVSLRDGTLHARIHAEQSVVVQLLRDKSHELQKILRDLGIQVDQVSVSVSADGESSHSYTRNSDYEHQQQKLSEQSTDSASEQSWMSEDQQKTSAEEQLEGWVA